MLDEKETVSKTDVADSSSTPGKSLPPSGQSQKSLVIKIDGANVRVSVFFVNSVFIRYAFLML